jgi:hypothetical protein
VRLDDQAIEQEREIGGLLAGLSPDDIGSRARVLCPQIRPGRRFVVAMMIGRALWMAPLSTTERTDRLRAWCHAFGVSVDDVHASLGVPVG